MHLLTASGAVWGLLALLAASQDRLGPAMLWMGLAAAVDGVDGALARRARAREVLPRINGALLDNLVDFVNYAVVPAYVLIRARAFPAGTELAAGAAICLASAFQFSQADAKPGGRFFKGFPSYWNVVAVYLIVLGAPPAVALAVVGVLCALVFVPLLYVYPTRTPTLRSLTISLGVAWGGVVIAMIVRYPDAPGWLAWASLTYPLYYVVLSVWLSKGRKRWDA